MKKAVILLLMLVLAVAAADAALVIEVQNIDNSIYLDENARFLVNIINTDDNSKVVNVYTTDIEWLLELDPSISRIQPKSNNTIELRLVPSVWAEPGGKSVKVVFEAPNSDEKVEAILPVNVKSYESDYREYAPSVEMKVEFPDQIDPREPILLDIYLRNRNRLDIKDMEISVFGKLFSDYRLVNLAPLTERREKITFNLDPLTPPQSDRIEVVIKVNNKTVNTERSNYELIGYSEFVRTEDTLREPFKTTKEVLIINDGNIRYKDKVTESTNVLRKIFTSSSIPYDELRLSDGEIIWYLDLDPQEQVRIVITENYRPIIYVILIGIVVAIIYFLYRSPVVIRKESLIIGSSEEGITELKVLLHIRNRAQEIIEDIKVSDMIPSIASHVKESHIGSLAPTKVLKHEKKGTIVKYEIESLEAFEERIISYKLKSKIAVVGGFSLPSAKAKFTTQKGKERVVYSNKSNVSAGI